MQKSSSEGFSLAETVIALGVLTTGVIAAAGVLVTGMQHLTSSPADVVVVQKASQAIEAVFSARDSHKLTWEQIRNKTGEDDDGGIFVDEATPLKLAGPDGLVGTDDDTTVETVTLPGKDGIIGGTGAADDQVVKLDQYTRQITIRDVPNEHGQLRSIVVTVTFQNGPTKRSYTLSSFISAYS